MGDKNSASYSASKWGLIGLIKSVALEVGPYNVRINGISPATVATPLTLNQASYESTNPSNPTYEGFVQANLAQNALPHPYLVPQDIADAALWLVSPAARFVTGAAFDIALGRNARYTA